jgi:hypothetical protein
MNVAVDEGGPIGAVGGVTAHQMTLQRRSFVTAKRHQGQLAARAKKLSNLCDTGIACVLFVTFLLALAVLPALLYNHDILGDGGDFLSVPATIQASDVHLTKTVRGTGKNQRTTYYIHALVMPHIVPADSGLEGPDAPPPHVPSPAPPSDDGEQEGTPPVGLSAPGHGCSHLVPVFACRLYEDLFSAREAPRGDGKLPLVTQFSDSQAAEAALAKVRAASSVLQDRETGRLYLLRDAPVEPYLLLAAPLAIASVILACNAASQRIDLWNSADAAPLPPPTRVWVDDVRRYMWQLHPVPSQLLPQAYSGAVVKALSAACVLLNTLLLLDAARAYSMCAAAADCAVPVLNIVTRGMIGGLQVVAVLVPAAAYVFGQRVARVGSAVNRAQLCVGENFSLSHLQNVAWPAGSTRTVHLRQAVLPLSRPGESGQRTVTSATLTLARWRTSKRDKKISHTVEESYSAELLELRNAALPSGSTISTQAELTLPAEAVVSSFPGSGIPFDTWYLVYTAQLQGVGEDKLMVPLHVVPPLVGGGGGGGAHD